MTHINRVVVGLNEEKKSAVILRDTPNYQEGPGMVWRSMLWATTELPVDNQIPGDRSLGAVIREPAENGLMFRVLELPPDPKDPQKHLAFIHDFSDYERVVQTDLRAIEAIGAVLEGSGKPFVTTSGTVLLTFFLPPGRLGTL